MHAPAIQAQSLSKRFRIFSGSFNRMLGALLGTAGPSATENWAIKGLDLTIDRGEAVGIIGRNGSGKSTLLKLIAGALEPSAGQIKVVGRVLALLELGTGFNPELTGRQNVLLAAQMHAFEEDDIRTKLRDIETFADLSDYFDRPVKTYSSGMFVRLAFATFIFMKPDILVIDEALSVGDVFFQQKCFNAIMEMKERGTTILFVSHDMTAVRRLCDRAILIDHGVKLFDGAPEEAVTRFYALRGDRRESPDVRAVPAVAGAGGARGDLAGSGIRIGGGGGSILFVRCLDDAGADMLHFEVGSRTTIELLFEAHSDLQEPNVGIEIYDRFNQLVFGTSLKNMAVRLGSMRSGERCSVRIYAKLDLMPGQYALSAAVADQFGSEDPNAGTVVSRIENMGPITVRSSRELLPFYGLACLPSSCEVVELKSVV